MADEIKKYTNRLRDRSSGDVYFVYDTEALHADSSISLLTNDAGYVKRTEMDEIVASNPAFIKPDQLSEYLSNYASIALLNDSYVKKEDVGDLAGSGETFVDYSELDSVDINDLQYTNVSNNTLYKIANATNNPIGTGTSGVLGIRKLSDNLKKEEWNTSTGKAERLVISGYTNYNRWGTGNISGVIGDTNAAVVNTEDAYYLKAGAQYSLIGVINKKIIIGKFTKVSDTQITNFEELTAADSGLSTVLYLKGVCITSNGETAIDYPSKYGSLSIIVTPYNNGNAIIVEADKISGELSALNEHELRSTAVIHSGNNIYIGGRGLLAIKSDIKNHGIKADNVSIKDYIQLFIDLENGHDGIHIGNNHRLLISDGNITIKNCRAAVDIDSEGILEILGGKFTFSGNTTDIDCSACTKRGRIFNMSGDTLIDISNSSENIDIITPLNIREIYGAPSVTTKDGVTEIQNDGSGTYRITTDVTLSGYFNNRQIYIAGADSETQTVDIYLEDAYIENHERRSLSGKGQTIIYAPETGKLDIHCVEGTTNFVVQTQQYEDGDGYGAIKSKNNITIQGAGNIFVSSKLSDAIDGSNVTVKGNGFRSFESLNLTRDENDNYVKAAISAKAVYIGEDGDTDPSSAENSFQTIYAKNIVATRNKKGEKGIVNVLRYQLGHVVCEEEIRAETSRNIEALEEDFEPVIFKGQLSRYSSIKLETDTDYFDNAIQQLTRTATDWKVFVSVAEVNSMISSLSEQFNTIIEGLKTRITNLEHKHLIYYPPTAAGDHTDGNIEYWYCPACDEYYTDELAQHQVTREDVIIPKLIPDEEPGEDEGTEDIIDNSGNTLEVEARDENGDPISIDIVENN